MMLNNQSLKKYYLVLDHIDARDVNAISGGLIYGTPALTAIAGFVHNLNRKIDGLKTTTIPVKKIQLKGFMVIAHQCDPKIYREHAGQDYTFLLKKAPLTRTGANPPIIEEGRLDYISSLVVSFTINQLLTPEQRKELSFLIQGLLPKLRYAGGVIESVRYVRVIDNNIADTYKAKVGILRQIGFGYVLLSQEKLLEELVVSGKGIADYTDDMNIDEDQGKRQKDGLDYLLETAMMHYIPPKEEGDRWHIKTIQQERGWLVPLMVGYQGITDIFSEGVLKEIRMPEYASQFVEPIYSLGKWMLTYRLLTEREQSLEHLFWYPVTEDDLFLLRQDFE